MASRLSVDLSEIKAAGVYIIEIDESQRTDAQYSALRLLVGFSSKGPFNRAVLLQNEVQRQKLFGDIDVALEKKGCFFNRSARTMLTTGNVWALNLLKVDSSYDGPDQVNYAALSLDAGKRNPVVVNPGNTYGEVDYLAESVDASIYGTVSGDVIPYIGKTPYAALFDKGAFWMPESNNLMQIAAVGLGVAGTSYEKANFLNFANCGTDEISILVYKAENFNGYNITAKDWWGGKDNIPYKWIRPSDYISDYFIKVVAVKGNWSNYPLLSADSTWSKYFDSKGILKEKIFDFTQAEGITYIGSWTGSIIPDFTDKQGNYLYIKDRINANTITTGLMVSVNEEAMELISYDLNGVDVETGLTTGTGCWIYDYDSNEEGESDANESEIGQNGFLIDMIGHTFQDGITKKMVNTQLLTSYDKIIFDDNKGTLTDISVYYLDDAENLLEPSIAVTNQTTVKVPAFADTTVADICSEGNQLYLYDVIDASTGRKIKADYSYIAMDNNSYSAMNKKTGYSTDLIMKQIAYTPDGDTSLIWNPSAGENGKYEEATIGDMISAYDISVFNLKVKKDTTENALYVDEPVLFGNYAAYSNTKKDGKSIYLFSVQSGINSAEVVDGDILSWSSLEDGSLPIEVKNPSFGKEDADTSTMETITEDVPCKIFSYNATKYYVVESEDETGARIYVDEQTGLPENYGVTFLSYNYVSDTPEEVLRNIRNCFYFNGKKNSAETDSVPVKLEDTNIFFGENPVGNDVLNMFIVADEQEAADISEGDLVTNITYYNCIGDATKYGLIPGVTRVISKRFVNLTANNQFTYKSKVYTYNNAYAPCIKTKSGKRGFYLYTTIDPVLIDKHNIIVRQLPISNSVISKSLRFIPLKGLHISARHRPGFDTKGRINVEAGIEKIYSTLMDEGIRKSLTNPNVLDYRYIVDSMSYGIEEELGGKKYLSRLAMDRSATTALLNAPSKAQFQNSRDPYFTDTFDESVAPVPAFKVKYIVEGGNADMYSTKKFSLPTEDNGSKFAACFYPHLIYRDNSHDIIVPPAADVSNTFQRKFQNGNPYAITANMDGILQNSVGWLRSVEYDVATEDRAYLQPFGINSIIREDGVIKIYGNQTCYQDTKSDFNKLHVRENLNTMEREINAVLKNFVFKYNNEQTRAALFTQVTPILEAMRSSGVLASYEMEVNDNNTNELMEDDFMFLDISVYMNHGMEKIIQRIKVKKLSDLAS